jgi:hypothetical protein
VPASLGEAVVALNTTLLGLLPPAVDPALAPELFLIPLHSQFAGVGAVVGIRTEAPAGEITALRVTAQAVVRVKAASVAQLTAVEAGVSLALLGADPANLRSSGIFRIRPVGQNSDLPAGAPADPAQRDVRFEVLYEFSKQPESAEGTISSIPVDLLLRSSTAAGSAPRELLLVDCEQNPLPLFEPVDDAGLGAPGQWQYNAAQRELRQTSAAGGGSDAFDANKPGTYLLIRPGSTPPAPSNFVLYTSMRSDASGGIGLIFRFQDIDNFYFVLLHDNGNPAAPFRYRIIGRKLAGAFSFLDAGGTDDNSGYAPGTWFSLRLAAQDDQFDVAIDGVDVLSGRDGGITSPGRVGFMCRDAAGARFRFLHWEAL